MGAKRPNDLLRVENGVAFVDVSTKKYPDAVCRIDEVDISIMLDGRQRWVILKGKHTLYALRNPGGRKAPRWEFLHRLILGVTDRAIEVDHRDGDGLNNCRFNLRPATNYQNAQNSRQRRGTSSQFKGVSWDKEKQKWYAKIGTGEGLCKIRSLGRYNDETEAARAYDAAALSQYGEFAKLNFPEKHRGE